MRNDININNNGTLNNQNLKNEEIKKDNKTNHLGGEAVTVTQSKSRKWFYIILIIIIAAIIYFIRNQYNNSDNVNYSKISKYSYYDF